PRPLSPRNGQVPPSGQVNFSAPLSVANTTTVLSAIPSSSSLASSSPTTQSSSCMPSAYTPRPVLSFQRSDRRVQTCIRVVLCQSRNGMLASWAGSMKARGGGGGARHVLRSGRHPLPGQRTGVGDGLLADPAETFILGRVVHVGGLTVQ